MNNITPSPLTCYRGNSSLGPLLATVLLLVSSLATCGNSGFEAILKPTFEENCIKCHGKEGKVKGELNLMEISRDEDLVQMPERIRDLIDVLEFEDMPPEDEPGLAAETRKEMIAALEKLMHTAIVSQKSLPHTPIRRMNRFQYNNAVKDLFDLKVEVFPLPERMLREHSNYFNPASGVMPAAMKVGSRPMGKSQLIEKRLGGIGPFPQDLRAEHGYDNRGDHLSLSPLLMESFLTLSRSIVGSVDFHEEACGIWEAFFAAPNRDADLKSVIENRLRSFLTQAFRRPVDPATLDRYVENAAMRIQSGDTFLEAIRMVASAALASPRFLYLYDHTENDSDQDLSKNFNLASRLSFFLWGSLPDHTLLEKAANGELRNRDALSKEVDRLLGDEKLKRFCDSFPAQWLQLDRIISSAPDPDVWPEFYFAKWRASMHMMLEPLLLFETIIVENRSLLELIDSDYSYRSEYLSSWYRDGSQPKRVPTTQIPFERVSLDDRRQGGVITSAAVMTMTSNATRSKPITRGAWVASVIFNNPPDPPPADVPPLAEESTEIDIENLTLRERLDLHRNNAECSGCHSRIDPLGFALENYGPTGLWRDRYENGRTVDSQGTLFRKHPFNNILEFKDAILLEKARFVKAFAGHVLSFALGRELGITDHPALDQITQKTIEADYRIQTLIKEVVMSDPFLQFSSNSKSLVAESAE